MPASTKTATAMAASRKKSSTSGLVVTLKTSPDALKRILDPQSTVQIKEETPAATAKESPATSTTLPAPSASNGASNEEPQASDSGRNTPGDAATPSQTTAMAPAEPAPKKGRGKRSAAAANGDDVPKVRGKPGPKKRKLDDGTLDPNAPSGRQAGYGAGHKLGPKASLGAINAGLRALDRSGKPCRKWQRGGFKLKTFTGVAWEIHRWTAPPKPKPEQSNGDPSASADSSSKENKDGSQVKSETSNAGPAPETRSVPSLAANSPAPAPMPVAVA